MGTIWKAKKFEELLKILEEKYAEAEIYRKKESEEKELDKFNDLFEYGSNFENNIKRWWIVKLTFSILNDSFTFPKAIYGISNEACWYRDNVAVPHTIYSKTLIFPKNIAIIGRNSFRRQSDIKKVIIENNTEVLIHKGAFSSCSSLEEVILPENVIFEGSDSSSNNVYKIFEGDGNLKTITLPTNFKIQATSTSLCTVLPDTIETIHWKNTRMSAYLFKDLKKSYWVNDIEKVKNTFLKLKNIYGLENVIEIGEECFAENSSLEKLSFPNAKLVEKKAFFNCTGLKEIFLEKVEEIKEETFSGCKNLKRLYLSHVKEVKKGAFKDCINLESIILDNVKVIGEGAFSNCKSLKEVHIPKIEEIGNLVFKDCLELTCIEIPDTIKLIGDNIFKGCTKLAVCIIKKECEYLLNETSFFDCEKERKEIICNPTMSLEVFTFSKSVYLEKQLQTIGISIDIPSNKKIFSVTLECLSETVLASLSSYDRVLIKVNCYNITQEEQEVEIKATVSTY